MSRTHLREREAEILVDYLLHPIKPIEERDRNLDKDLSNPYVNRVVRELCGDLEDAVMRAVVRAKMDQAFAKLQDYGMESSFGKEREEIIRNAKTHFGSCYICCERYMKVAEARIEELEETGQILEENGEKFAAALGGEFVPDGLEWIAKQIALLRNLVPN